MLTKEEYEKTLIRMFDSIRPDSDYKGDKHCTDIDCEKCPLNDSIDCCSVVDVFKAIEIVEEWGKEHPIVTMEDKFVEVFGHRPVNSYGNYFCPPGNPDDGMICSNSATCKECINKFWKSEYIPPKKGE